MPEEVTETYVRCKWCGKIFKPNYTNLERWHDAEARQRAWEECESHERVCDLNPDVKQTIYTYDGPPIIARYL
jgi:hypothetical protein